MTTSANELQVAGTHYKELDYQPWDFIDENNIRYLEGNVIKYIVRHKKKNGVQDLEKAKHYVQKIMELEESEDRCNMSDVSVRLLQTFIRSNNLTPTEADPIALIARWRLRKDLERALESIDDLIREVEGR